MKQEIIIQEDMTMSTVNKGKSEKEGEKTEFILVPVILNWAGKNNC